MTKCTRAYAGYDSKTMTSKTTPSKKTGDEASTIVTLQLTYLFW